MTTNLFNNIAWLEKLKNWLRTEKHYWQQISVIERIRLVCLIVIVVIMMVVILYIAFHGLMADVSVSSS